MQQTKRPTFRSLGHDEGEAVEAVFERALSVDPADRFQNVGHFWDALRAAFSTGATVRSPALFDVVGNATALSGSPKKLVSEHPTKPEGKRLSEAPVAPLATNNRRFRPCRRSRSRT